MLHKNVGNHVPDMLFDKHNNDMLDNVRPRFWVDPGEEETKEEAKGGESFMVTPNAVLNDSNA